MKTSTVIDKEALLYKSALEGSEICELNRTSSVNNYDAPYIHQLPNTRPRNRRNGEIPFFTGFFITNDQTTLTPKSSSPEGYIKPIDTQVLHINFKNNWSLLNTLSKKKAEMINKLEQFTMKRDIVDISKKPDYSNKLEQAFDQICTLNYSKFSIELTTINVLNVNLLFEKNNLLMLSIPLDNNVVDLQEGQAVFSYFENKECKASSSKQLSQIIEDFKAYSNIS